MKILLSLNNKFYSELPLNFIKFLEENDKCKTVAGFEVVVDINNEEEKNYIKNLSFICKQNNYHLQFHGNSDYSINNQKKYIDFVNEIGEFLDRKMYIVLHPQTANTIEEEIKLTNLYFSEILNYIYEMQYNIEISVENLNSTTDIIRLSKDYLKPILSNNMDLNFTYDMGHEIMEYGELIDLDTVLIDRISNIHIHTFDSKEEHKPIFENSINKDKWIKAIQYLNYINFDKTVVLEYDFYMMGEDYYERLLNYIKSAEFMYSYIGR